MIQAKELRIGNLIRPVDGIGGMVVVNFLYYSRPNWIANWSPINVAGSGIDSLSKFEPIPLTPSILEQCGFERTKD